MELGMFQVVSFFGWRLGKGANSPTKPAAGRLRRGFAVEVSAVTGGSKRVALEGSVWINDFLDGTLSVHSPY